MLAATVRHAADETAAPDLPAAFVVVDVAVFIDSKYGSPDSLWPKNLKRDRNLHLVASDTLREML